MSKITLAILIILTFTGCKKSNDDLKNNETEIAPLETKSIKNHHPIFLGLSPYMTETEFSNEINNLNSQSKLNGSRFIVQMDNKDYYFEVKKTANTIKLIYSDQTSKAIQNVSYKISEGYLQLYQSRMNDFLKIFDSKYDKKIIMPTNIHLSNYGLSKENYQIFRDSSKTVLIGYKLNGYRYPSPSEREYENSKKEKEIPDGILDNIGEQMDRGKERSNFVVFGLDVEIDYYYNEEFDELFKKIKTDSDIEKKNELMEKQKEIEIKKVSKNNVKEL
jgi:hypothetical protein